MATVEETRVVVGDDETFEGKIIPTERAEIGRPVTVHSGATVTEGVYGESIAIEEDAVVAGPVMASEAVELDGGVVEGGVGTPGRVEARDADVTSTVTGTKVRLVNCVVRANVVATDVILENCTVLGVVAADRTLEARNSLCYTFKAYGGATLTNANVVLPQVVADGELTLNAPIQVLGLGSVDGVEGDGRLSLSKADAVTHEDTRYLTFADRVLNLDKVRDRIEELDDQLRAAVVDGGASAEELYRRLGVDALPHEDGGAATVGSIDEVAPDDDADGDDDPAEPAEATPGGDDELFDEAFGDGEAGGDADGDEGGSPEANGDGEDDEFFEF